MMRLERSDATTAMSMARVLTQLAAMLLIGAVTGWGVNQVWKSFRPSWTSRALFAVNGETKAGQLDAERLAMEVATQAERACCDSGVRTAVKSPEFVKTELGKRFVAADGTLREDDAFLAVRRALRASPLPNTRLFALEFTGRDPVEIEAVLGIVSNTYIRNLAVGEDAMRRRQVLERQREELDRAIMDKNRQIQDFIRQNGLTSLDANAEESDHALQGLGDEIRRSVTELSTAKARLNVISFKLNNNAGADAEDRRRASEDPMLSKLIEQHELARQASGDGGPGPSPGSPEFEQAKSKLEDAKWRLDRKEAEIIDRNLRADAKRAESEVDRLETLLKGQIEDLAKMRRLAEDRVVSMVEISNLNGQMEMLRQRRNEAGQSLQQVFGEIMFAEPPVTLAQGPTKPCEITLPRLRYTVPATSLAFGLLWLVWFVRQRAA